MNAAELDALLRQYLVDGKFSRSDREVLTTWANRNVNTDAKRAEARSRVFAIARAAATDGNAVELIAFLEDVLSVLQPVSSQPSV